MNYYPQQYAGGFSELLGDTKKFLKITFTTPIGLMIFCMVMAVYFLTLFIYNTESKGTLFVFLCLAGLGGSLIWYNYFR